MKKPTAIVVLNSDNGKLSASNNCATTYAARQSCSEDCPFFKSGETSEGCYGDNYGCSFTFDRLTKNAKVLNAKPSQISIEASYAIDSIKRPNGRPLRVHTTGDCKTSLSAERVSGAARRYKARGGGPAWTYTHAWKIVPRVSWKGVSCLASVETVADGKRAMVRGYVPARVVDRFKGRKAFVEGGIKWIPCQAQLNDDSFCDTCRLCWDDKRLKKLNAGILFEAHGIQKNKVMEKIREINKGE